MLHENNIKVPPTMKVKEKSSTLMIKEEQEKEGLYIVKICQIHKKRELDYAFQIFKNFL